MHNTSPIRLTSKRLPIERLNSIIWTGLAFVAYLLALSLHAQPYVQNLTNASISVRFYYSEECDDIDFYQHYCVYIGFGGDHTYAPPGSGYVYHGLKVICGECVGGTIVASVSCLGDSDEFSCGGNSYVVRGDATRVTIAYN